MPVSPVYGLLLFCKGFDVGQYDRLLTCIRPLDRAVARGLDGLFAREFPFVKSGLAPYGGVGFNSRRFDLFAVSQTPLQSLVDQTLKLTASTLLFLASLDRTTEARSSSDNAI